MNSRKLISIVLGLLLIVGGFFAVTLIMDSKDDFRPPQAKSVKSVFVETVLNKPVSIVVPANGNLVAKRRMELYSEVQGVFRKSNKLFKPGQNYNAGETLINIDASEYYASVQSAKSSLYDLITSIMPDLRLDYPDIFPKWQSFLTNFDLSKSTPDLPEMTTEKEKFFISGRGILTSYYNVKNLEQRLAKYTISAPFKGTLTDALVTEGTLVRSGQKLGEFIQDGVYELEVAISEKFGDLLVVGKSVDLYDLDKINSYTGKIVRINGSVDQTSQTITTFIEVKNNTLKEGMYLEANLEAKQEQSAIEVERGLLLENNQIFTVRDSVLDVIDVEPVYFTDKNVVLKNVPDGTRIVSKPIVGGYAGMLVEIVKAEATIDKSNKEGE